MEHITITRKKTIKEKLEKQLRKKQLGKTIRKNN
jgi:hypothetical protein